MNNDFSLSRFIKCSTPLLFCLFLILCNGVPSYPFSGFMHPVPYVLIVIFYFGIFNPKLLNGGMVFCLAIFSELLVQSPLGLLIISYVLIFFLANFLRSYLYNLTFFRLWLVFAIFVCGTMGMQYGLFCLMASRWVPIINMCISVGVLITVYPLIMRICANLDSYAREVR